MNRLNVGMMAMVALLIVGTVPAQEPQYATPAEGAAEPPQFLGMVGAHNTWRREVGVPDLAWSPEAARWAQSWADELAENECQARHNPDPARREAYGENIYFYWASRPYDGYRRDPSTVVRAWATEQQWYDEESNQCRAPQGKTCRHYTQVVWSRSTAVGCGRARCESAEIWVCNYAPRGNLFPVRPYELSQKPPRTMADTAARPVLPEVTQEPENLLMPMPAAPAALPFDGLELPAETAAP